MTANILDGRMVAAQIKEALKEKIKLLQDSGNRAPALAVILVGNDPASQIYVANKRKACIEAGFTSQAYDLPEDTSQETLAALIHKLNADPLIDGVLVQLPLPAHINSHTIIETIAPQKDIDGFHPYNLGRLAQRRPLLRPCTPYGIMKLLKYYDLHPKGKHAVVIGASNIVGRPMSLELLLAGATVTTCHRFTQNLEKHVSAAELLVVAVGKMDIVQPEWISPGTIVIDVGIHRLPDGKLRGDLNFEAVAKHASWLTPVPFGVGPMTIATLLSNTLHAMEHCS